MKSILFLFALSFACTIFGQTTEDKAVRTTFTNARGISEENNTPTDEQYLYSHGTFSQVVLLGKWKRVGNFYSADLSIDDNLFFYEKYFINTHCKIEETMMKYTFMNDSLVMHEFGPEEGAKKVVLWLKQLTTDSLIVQDAETFEIERFIRADSTLPDVPMPSNELRYVRGVLNCVQDMSHSSVGSDACIHIGDLNLDLKLEYFEERFGNASQYVESKDEANISKYVFHLKPYQGTQPELIVTYDNAKEQTQEIQVRGLGSEENLAFSAIHLGDYITYVEKKLGKPADITEDTDKGTLKWSYKPFPVIFEFKNRYVNGIKIYRK